MSTLREKTMSRDYFVDSESLEKLLSDYQSIFALVDDYAQQFVQGVLTTPEDYKEALRALTGAFMTLYPLYTQSEAYKNNQEIQAYVTLKRELEAKGEKVVATSLEKESSLAVAIPRRVRNVLEGYVEAASKAIGTCQTQLKRFETEIKNRNTEINE